MQPVRRLAGALVVGLSVATASAAGVPFSPRGAHETRASRAALTLLPNVSIGTRLGSCTVVSGPGLAERALRVGVAAPDGSRFDLDVLRRSPAGPAGIAETDTLSVYVANGGGDTRPVEQAAATALARILREREASGADTRWLPTLAERRGTSDR